MSLRSKIIFKASKYTAGSLCTVLSLHFASDGWAHLERYTFQKSDELKQRVVAEIIDRSGYKLSSLPLPSTDLKTTLQEASRGVGLRPELIEAVIKIESNWNEAAIRFEPSLMHGTSEEARMLASSHGLTQVLGSTAKSQCGLSWHELYDRQKNITCSLSILKESLTHTKSVYKSLVEYNGGAGVWSKPAALMHAKQYAERVLIELGESTATNTQF